FSSPSVLRMTIKTFLWCVSCAAQYNSHWCTAKQSLARQSGPVRTCKQHGLMCSNSVWWSLKKGCIMIHDVFCLDVLPSTGIFAHKTWSVDERFIMNHASCEELNSAL